MNLLKEEFLDENKIYNPDQAVLEANKCILCKNPACNTACPLGIDIKSFIKNIQGKKFSKALETIRNSNYFPGICGRICPKEKYCELHCVLREKEGSIDISGLETFVSLQVHKDKPQKKTKYKVAIIGGGPTGLSSAASLAKKGHGVTVYDAMHKIGGSLGTRIPAFDLPDKVIEELKNDLENIGVKFEENVVVGKSIDLKELLSDYDSILIACGFGTQKELNIPGEHLSNVYNSSEFLTRINLMKAHLKDSDTKVTIGDNIIVIGDSSEALNCARIAKKMGSRVYVLYNSMELKAREIEIIGAKNEGVEFLPLTGVIAINGKFKANSIRCIQMMMTGYEGERVPEPIEGSEFEMACDQIIVSTEPYGNKFAKLSSLHHDVNCFIKTDSDLRTNFDKVYAAGGCVKGELNIVEAIKEGIDAAIKIDEGLRKESYI